MRLDRISPDDVEAVAIHGSAANVNRARRTLRRMLGKAQEWKLIRFAPKIKLAKEYGRSAVLDTDSEAKLLVVAKQPLKDVLIVMLDTGMRPQEVFSIRWEDVNWETGTIFIPRGKTRNARRYVPISQRLRIVLENRFLKNREGWVFPAKSKSGHLETVGKAYVECRRKAGINPSIVLYTARHTFATRTLAATGNLAVLMRAMGHSSAQTAMIYQHPNLDSVRQAIDNHNLNATLRHNSRHSTISAIQ